MPHGGSWMQIFPGDIRPAILPGLFGVGCFSYLHDVRGFLLQEEGTSFAPGNLV